MPAQIYKQIKIDWITGKQSFLLHMEDGWCGRLLILKQQTNRHGVIKKKQDKIRSCN